MRFLFLDGPAWVVDQFIRLDAWVTRGVSIAWQAYWLLIAAGSIVCLTTAALTLALHLLGVPIALPPPEPPPVMPANRSGGRA